MVTSKDFEVIEFLKQYKVATTDTIKTLFYGNLRTTQHRLKVLSDKKLLNRSRDNVSNEYIYYLKRPAQLRHKLLVTDFYRELSKQCKIAFFTPEPQIHNRRPDAFFGYTINGVNKLGFLEVEISNKGFDYSKYSDKTWCQELPLLPKIFVVSDKLKLKEFKTDFKLFVVNTGLLDLKYYLR